MRAGFLVYFIEPAGASHSIQLTILVAGYGIHRAVGIGNLGCLAERQAELAEAGVVAGALVIEVAKHLLRHRVVGQVSGNVHSVDFAACALIPC